MSFFGSHNHCHIGSNLRLRDSINKINDLFEYAHSLGHKGIAITDHEAITAHLDALMFHDTVKDKEGWENWKTALGNEIYLCSDNCVAENARDNIYPHFILIACDAEGHKGIRELSTKAWIDNSFMSVMMRVPTYYHDLEEIMGKYKGHIIGQSACLGGTLPCYLLQYRDTNDNRWWDKSIAWIEYMNDLFGEGYFFLEMQPGIYDDQKYVNKKLIELSEITHTPYLISTDAHYTRKEDREIHKVYLNSQDGDREVDDFYATTYVMSEEEIHSYMDDYLGYETVQKGIDNTMLIYDKVTMYDLRKPLKLPYMPLNATEPDEVLYQKYKDKVPLYQTFYESEYDSDRHLLSKLLEYMDKDPDYQNENAYENVNLCLDYLLQSSEKNNVRWSAYLLQESDYIDICWACDSVVGAGRGSGVGFCLLHMLGITQINPMKETTKTYPWRFMNPNRVSVLDIDQDIAPNKRDVIIQKMKDIYGADKVSKVMTIQTEKPRSAILTAARGVNLDNDLASYIASLVVFDRGNPRSLQTMYYGNDEYDPVPDFVREMNSHPDLWQAAQKIEGLVSGMGSHAGGVVIADEPLTNSTALMRTSSGDIVTAFDLHKLEEVSLIKIDLLATDAVWKIQETLNQLLKAGKIEWQGTLRDTYEKYIGIYTLERDNIEMWKMLWEHKVLSFFQMEKESGKQALALAKPKSVDDLATINSVIRLMASEKGAETPLQKYARFHENIRLWYEEMDKAGLTQEEQNILKEILSVSSGICEAQEYLVLLVTHPLIGGFSLDWGDKLRKAVAKKKPKDFMQLEKEFFENAKEKGLSKKFVEYVWYSLIYQQRGYGFNKSHTLSYSLIGLQELNLCWEWNPIYWSTANLIVDSGSGDEESNESTNYGKMGVAIAKIQSEGVKISPPNINTAEFGFKPIEETNEIIFGLKGINSINTDIANQIISNCPYSNMEDFAQKMLDTKIIKPSQMMMLIKGGCFDEFIPDRSEIMGEYLRRYLFEPCKQLTLAQLKKLETLNILPDELKTCVSYLKYKDYVINEEGFVENHIDENKKTPKCGYHDRYYILDEPSQDFFMKHFSEDSVVRVQGEYYVISEKKFSKEVDKLIQPLRDWMANEKTLKIYNKMLFDKLWNEKCPGNEAAWAMQSLSYYDKDHELKGINEKKYGIVNFFDLPETPDHYETYYRWIDGERKELNKYIIHRIAGTVLNADNLHSIISLLTCYGVVNVKYPKNTYAFYNRRLSQVINDKGEKQVVENSWFKRGNLIIVAGYRREDTFVPKVYQDTAWKHTTNLITTVNYDGTLELQLERTKI